MTTNTQLNPAIREPVLAATHSFLAGYVVNALASGAMWRGINVTMGLSGGILSATASIIDSALRPVIGMFFDANGESEFFQWLTRTVIVFSILTVIPVPFAAAGANAGINIISSIVARMVVYMISGFVENQVVMVN